MANVKVKTVGAIVNGQPLGSTLELEEDEAKRLEAAGYVEIQAEEPEPKPKAKRKKTKDD